MKTHIFKGIEVLINSMKTHIFKGIQVVINIMKTHIFKGTKTVMLNINCTWDICILTHKGIEAVIINIHYITIELSTFNVGLYVTRLSCPPLMYGCM